MRMHAPDRVIYTLDPHVVVNALRQPPAAWQWWLWVKAGTGALQNHRRPPSLLTAIRVLAAWGPSNRRLLAMRCCAP